MRSHANTPPNEAAAAAPLDVLILLNSLTIGGSERKTVALANSLAEQGLAVGCAYLNQPHTLLSELAPSVERWFLDRRGRVPLRVLRQLARLIRTRQARTVIAVNLYPAMLLAVVGTTALRLDTRKVALVNTSSLLRPLDRLIAPLYRWTLRSMDAVVYGSEVQRRGWVRPTDPDWSRSCVIYNGVDTAHFTPATADEVATARRAFHIPAHRFVLGAVGRLVPEKNHRALIDLLRASFPKEVHLLLVGDGPLREDLETHARDHGVADRVTFAGPQRDVRAALCAMDAFALPSVAVETFSNAALEAMAMGLPVLLSDVSSAAEMIRENVEGMIVPVDSLLPRMTSAVGDLIADDARRAAMSVAARRTAVDRFGFSAMQCRYRDVIHAGVK
jgi:glycosyltransferase involved in cell wall biosynthesis